MTSMVGMVVLEEEMVVVVLSGGGVCGGNDVKLERGMSCVRRMAARSGSCCAKSKAKHSSVATCAEVVLFLCLILGCRTTRS